MRIDKLTITEVTKQIFGDKLYFWTNCTFASLIRSLLKIGKKKKRILHFQRNSSKKKKTVGTQNQNVLFYLSGN